MITGSYNNNSKSITILNGNTNKVPLKQSDNLKISELINIFDNLALN